MEEEKKIVNLSGPGYLLQNDAFHICQRSCIHYISMIWCLNAIRDFPVVMYSLLVCLC